MTRISIGVSLDMKFVSLIDSKRGDVPRSRFIEKILSKNIDNKPSVPSISEPELVANE